ncbi:MAG: chromosomal replication initiator protein DnaA [Planctomycetota bacterium]
MTANVPEGSTAAATDIWQAVFQSLSNNLSRDQIQTWFHRVCAIDYDGQSLTLAVPSEFHRNWILENYSNSISSSLQFVLGVPIDLKISIDPEKAILGSSPLQKPLENKDNRTIPAISKPPVPAPPVRENISNREPLLRDSSFQLSLNPNYTFDNFVVGPCNRFAYAGAMGVSENPAKAYNPLFLHGSVGLGKTHLLQGVCYELLRRKPTTRILFLSCETFTNHFIAALEKGALEEFRRRYRSVDILVVDDIHFLANKERTQEEFFHTFNALFQDEKQIVLSSDSPAQEIPTLQERLISRFKWGLEAEIEKPCFETRIAILQRKARTMDVSIPDEIVQFLAEHITNNIRELEGAINRVVGYAALQRETVSLDLVRRIMPEIDTDRTTVVRFEDVAAVVSKKFHLKILDLQSRRRHQSIAFPRQVAMYLSRRHTKHSLEEIGAYYGGRDHTTVLYAIDKITDVVRTDANIRETVNSLADDLSRSFPRGVH